MLILLALYCCGKAVVRFLLSLQTKP